MELNLLLKKYCESDEFVDTNHSLLLNYFNSNANQICQSDLNTFEMCIKSQNKLYHHFVFDLLKGLKELPKKFLLEILALLVDVDEVQIITMSVQNIQRIFSFVEVEFELQQLFLSTSNDDERHKICIMIYKNRVNDYFDYDKAYFSVFGKIFYYWNGFIFEKSYKIDRSGIFDEYSNKVSLLMYNRYLLILNSFLISTGPIEYLKLLFVLFPNKYFLDYKLNLLYNEGMIKANKLFNKKD